MSKQPVTQTNDVSEIIGASAGTRRIRSLRYWFAAALVIGLTVAFFTARKPAAGNSTPRFLTEVVGRDALVVTVSATGNLAPTDEVDVGSELSGIIDKVFVDDNDRVKKGQVLALLDISKLKDSVDHSKAALASAEAGVLQTQATVKESRANLERLREVFKLSGGKVPSKTEMEAAEATLQRALANEAVAQASVKQSRATLGSDETNLTKASIRAPMNGIVLERKIEPGQTVAAAMTTPVLFTLAQDLVQMELQVDVDEADVGLVRKGQHATFTVDAYPNRKYKARVTRVNYGSQTKNNVISYKTILKVNNTDLSLRPGMTATADITVANRRDALLVPNAALRFTPSAAGSSTSAQPAESFISRLMPHPPREPMKRVNAASSKDGEQKVWVLQDGHPAAIPVKIGNTDGRMTEVTGGPLRAGMQVIVDTVESQK